MEWHMIQRTLYGEGPEQQILKLIGPYQLRRRSFRTLRPTAWLDDEIINAYTQLLRNRERQQALMDQRTVLHHAYTSSFVTLLLGWRHGDPSRRGEYDFNAVRGYSNRSPTRNIFRLQTLCVPVHINESHWVCIQVDFVQKVIQFMDSKGHDGTAYVEAIHRYIQDTARENMEQNMAEGWHLRPTGVFPRQNNDDDCGVFCCLYMDYRMMPREMLFNHTHTAHLRYRIAMSLMQGHIVMD